MGHISVFGTVIISLIVLAVIFLILREFVCWYYKINKRIENQERTNFLLEGIYERLGGKPETVKKDTGKDYSQAILDKELLDKPQKS